MKNRRRQRAAIIGVLPGLGAHTVPVAALSATANTKNVYVFKKFPGLQGLLILQSSQGPCVKVIPSFQETLINLLLNNERNKPISVSRALVSPQGGIS